MLLLRPSLCVALCLFSLAGTAGETVLLQAAQAKALGVETRLLDVSAGGRQGGLPAKVTVPNEQLRVVAAPVAGMVEQLLVAPGSAVKKGQVVARLASPQALELQRDMVQSGAQAELARQNLKRDEQLFAEGLIAESRLQTTRALATQASAQAAEKRQGLALAGVVAGKVGGPLELTAPLDGVVLEQGAAVGQRVEASALIYRIARLSPLWLEIQVPVALLPGLREGATVQVAGGVAEGRVIAVGRAVDAASQSVQVRAAVGKGAEALRPGQATEVVLESAAGEGLSIPASAVVRQDGKAVVFVQQSADDKGTLFQAREVKVLGQSGDSALVAGVKSGERIAVRGASALKAVWTGVGKE